MRFNQRGATAVEYGIIVSLIAAAIVFAVFMLGNTTDGLYRCTEDSFAQQVTQC